jgi:hypothetical protein
MSKTDAQKYQLPGMPDLDRVERTLAEVQAGTLPPDQQAEKERYLQESLVAIHNALPSAEQLEGLTKGIEQLVRDVQAGKFKQEPSQGGEA